MKMWKVYWQTISQIDGRTTDKRRSVKFTWLFSSGELKYDKCMSLSKWNHLLKNNQQDSTIKSVSRNRKIHKQWIQFVSVIYINFKMILNLYMCIGIVMLNFWIKSCIKMLNSWFFFLQCTPSQQSETLPSRLIVNKRPMGHIAHPVSYTHLTLPTICSV